IQVSNGSDITLTGNTLSGNNIGIALSQVLDGADADGVAVTITHSVFSTNAIGISFDNTTATVRSNTFAGNTSGIVNGNPTILIDAERNYWGAADGPQNLGGSGDSYSGNVDADPFLTAQLSVLGVNPQGILVQPVVGQSFTVAVGVIYAAYPASAGDFSAVIDWGD